MSNYGKLSEKDELIKSIREKAENIKDEKIKKAMIDKANVLQNNKTVTK